MEPTGWFTEPAEEMTMIKTCSRSGFRAGPDCPDTEEVPACINGLRSESCPWHKIIHLDKSGTRRVNADCFPPADIRNEVWFVLPPVMEYFYRQKHPEYRTLPPFAPGCASDKSIPVMEFIYPTSRNKNIHPARSDRPADQDHCRSGTP